MKHRRSNTGNAIDIAHPRGCDATGQRRENGAGGCARWHLYLADCLIRAIESVGKHERHDDAVVRVDVCGAQLHPNDQVVDELTEGSGFRNSMMSATQRQPQWSGKRCPEDFSKFFLVKWFQQAQGMRVMSKNTGTQQPSSPKPSGNLAEACSEAIRSEGHPDVERVTKLHQAVTSGHACERPRDAGFYCALQRTQPAGKTATMNIARSFTLRSRQGECAHSSFPDAAAGAKYWARGGIDQARQGAALKGMKFSHQKFNNFGE